MSSKDQDKVKDAKGHKDTPSSNDATPTPTQTTKSSPRDDTLSSTHKEESPHDSFKRYHMMNDDTYKYVNKDESGKTGAEIKIENLLSAVDDKCIEKIKSYLPDDKQQDAERKALVNEKGILHGKKTTALQIASEANDFQLVDLLFHKGANVFDTSALESLHADERFDLHKALSSLRTLRCHHLERKKNFYSRHLMKEQL
ncbi:uncharacterized protein [Ptychodera flava]|uniref:uncharacterized protein n=1 Tax=Ptychodera flava TaxID=63121 RepID=UPI00396A6737